MTIRKMQILNISCTIPHYTFIFVIILYNTQVQYYSQIKDIIIQTHCDNVYTRAASFEIMIIQILGRRERLAHIFDWDENLVVDNTSTNSPQRRFLTLKISSARARTQTPNDRVPEREFSTCARSRTKATAAATRQQLDDAGGRVHARIIFTYTYINTGMQYIKYIQQHATARILPISSCFQGYSPCPCPCLSWFLI